MTHETRRTPGATILIVEDEVAIVELLAVNLRHAGYQPLRALTVDEARSALREALPDLVLLDWMLPGQSGLAFAKELRANPRSREIPIIMLTARGEEPDKISGLEAGADDYVTKPFSPKELLARIKAVLRRRAPQATDDIVTLDGLSLDPAARRVSFTGKSKSKGEDGVAETVLLEPGPTEFRLLHFLMTHPERIYSRSQLLDQVWGDHVFIAERTVDVHIKRLREALAPAGAGVEAMVETVRGSGYRLVRLPVTEPEAESPL